MKSLVLFLLAVFPVYSGAPQENETQSPIVFIYDASGSMWGQLDGKTKMEIAAEVLTNSVNSLPENQNIGLVSYGHRKRVIAGMLNF